MELLRGLLIGTGIVAILLGGIWILQGLGLLMWPANSFMLTDKRWAINGAILAAAGLAAVIFGRPR